MADEVSEFLRRAADRRARQAEKKRRREENEATAPMSSLPNPLASRMPLSTPNDEVIVEAEVIEEPRRTLGNLSQRTALDSGKFARRASQLAENTEQADERMEGHLHKQFDHQLGNISRPSRSVTAHTDEGSKPDVVPEHPLLHLIRDPRTVSNAVVLGELLRRPEENW